MASDDLTSADIQSILDASPEDVARAAPSGNITPGDSGTSTIATAAKKGVNFLPLLGIGLLGYAATGSVKWSIGLGLAAQLLAANARR